MYFKRIEMHGFKSFAEHVTIEFDRGITCVVGPNGSGKSNISDAIRWVLGEQSPKMLRGSRMDDVIFAGTANRKSRGMAEVTLVIDNSEGILPIEYSEVAITRRMYRSGESEYAINNNQCRMKDIRELLMDTGIGVDGYSLIGQGKISEIISNKSDSIREIFEETAGIVSYRSKKAEAERKLATATDNMARVTDIINEIESRIDNLREDSQKASEYLTLKDRNKTLEVNITVKNIEDISSKAEALIGEINEVAKELQEANAQKEDFDKKQKDYQSKLQQLEEQSQALDGKLRECIYEVNKLANENNISTERLTSIQKETERLTAEIADIQEKSNREGQNAKELLLQKEKTDEEYNSLKEELDKEELANREALSASETISSDIDNMKNELFELSTKKSGWQAEKVSLANLFDSLEKNKEELLQSGKEDVNRQKLAEDSLAVVCAEESETKKEIDILNGEYVSLAKELKQEEQGKSAFEKEIARGEIEIGQATARKKAIEEMQNNYEGYNNGVKFVMKESIAGIHGVIADIVNVPDGYELAIETALGATMQNIVCEDDRAAKTAITKLKNNRAGRVTFLPIASIRSRGILEDPAAEKSAGFEGYAANIIDFDKRYKGIMESLLGNVVIVDDMDNATAMSKKVRHGIKYVTLDGEVISTSGAVTGGKYKHKRANIFERKSEIEALEKNILSLEKTKADNQNELAKKKERIAALIKEIDSKKELLREKEIALMSLASKREIAEKNVTELKKTSEVWEDSLNNIEDEKAKLTDKLNEVAEQIKRAEEKIKQNEKNIISETEKLESMSDDIKNANDKMTNAKIRLSACEGEKEKTDSLLQMINSTIETYQRDISTKNERLNALRQSKESIENDIKTGSDDIKNLTDRKEESEKALQEISESKAVCIKSSSELISAGDEINSKITHLQNRKYETDIKRTRYESQLENLKNKLWEDFEISYAQALGMREPEIAISSAVKENRQIKNRLRELGDVNVGAIKEYEEVSKRYEFLTEQREDIQKSTDELNSIIADTDKIIKKRFKESFESVTSNFEEIFKEFFGGGQAKITLDNEDDPLNAEIQITAQPPGKQLKHINLLSGGEKTMTAIALMFAVLKTKPTPCCILDEVEAALDDNNIHIFANYLKKFDDIQFTLITHQKTTMEHADVMYGVTMPERGISKVFSLKMTDELPV